MSQRDPDSNVSVYILVGLLIIVLGAAIPVIAAERTVLDSDHAVETMADEDVSDRTTEAFQEKLREMIREALAEDPSVDQESDPLLTDEEIQGIAETSLTESYVDAELTGQFERTYEYIYGDRDDLALVFDLGEPKQRAIAEAEAVEREARAQRGPGVTNPEAVPDDRLVIGSYLAEEFPSEQNITTGGEPPGEIETAATASGTVGILVWLLPVVAALLLGVLYYLSRSLHRTGEAAGAAFVAAGLLGLLGSVGGGPIVRSLVEGRLTLENPEFASLSDGVVAMVGDLFELMLLLSSVLVIVGVVVLGVVYADERGYFDSLTGGAESSGRREPTDQAQRDQYRESTNRESTGGDRAGYDERGSATAEREYVGADDQSAVGTDQSLDETDQSLGEPDHSSEADELDGYSDDESAAGAVENQTAESQDETAEYDPDQYDEHGFKRDSTEKSDNGDR